MRGKIMKDWMAIHTFLSEDAKAQHLSAKGLKRDNNKLTIKFEGGNYDFDIKHK